jgi:hypothetical protein
LIKQLNSVVLPVVRQRSLNQSIVMKTWLRSSVVVLGGLLASCQQEERTAQPSPDPAEGTWVMYPPLSIIEASPKNHPAGNTKADNLSAAQIEELWQKVLKREQVPGKAPETIKPQ